MYVSYGVLLAIASASASLARPSLNCFALIKSWAAFNGAATSGRSDSADLAASAGACARVVGTFPSATITADSKMIEDVVLENRLTVEFIEVEA